MEFIAIIAILLRGIDFISFIYRRVKFWDQKRRIRLYEASAIFLVSATIFGLTVYGLGGYLLVVLSDEKISFTDEWSPEINKLFFIFIFGSIFPVSFLYTIGFGGGSLQILVRTVKGEEYKSYGGIG